VRAWYKTGAGFLVAQEFVAAYTTKGTWNGIVYKADPKHIASLLREDRKHLVAVKTKSIEPKSHREHCRPTSRRGGDHEEKL
jgi:hypothetical protein